MVKLSLAGDEHVAAHRDCSPDQVSPHPMARHLRPHADGRPRIRPRLCHLSTL